MHACMQAGRPPFSFTWAREISAVAASSMRLLRGMQPLPPSQASVYRMHTWMLSRSVASVRGPSGTCEPRPQRVSRRVALWADRWAGGAVGWFPEQLSAGTRHSAATARTVPAPSPRARAAGGMRPFQPFRAPPHLEQVGLCDVYVVALAVELVRPWHVLVKDGLGDGDEPRVRNPGAVVAVAHLAQLVCTHLGHHHLHSAACGAASQRQEEAAGRGEADAGGWKQRSQTAQRLEEAARVR